MLRKLVKPVGGFLMGWVLWSGEDASAQTSGYVTPPSLAAPVAVSTAPPPTGVSLGYAEPTTNSFVPPINDSAPGVTISLDYVLFWLKSAPSSGPLLTTGSLADTAPGALGQPGTRVVFGEDGASNNAFNGLRMNVGTWMNEARTYGYEVGGFFLEHRVATQTFGSTAGGAPFLTRPFFNAQTNQQDSALESFPDFQKGFTTTNGSTRFAGWDANALFNASDTGTMRADWLVGFRCLYLTEYLSIDNAIDSLVDQGPVDAGFLAAGERVGTIDRFSTASNFYGPQIGGRVTWLSDRWITTATFKLALGVTDEVATLAGSTASRGNDLANGGFYVTPGNAGRYFHSAFSAVPELGLNFGYRIGQHSTLRLGYTFLYWSDVVRPGNLTGSAINPALVPSLQGFGVGSTNQPRASMSSSDFWAHGLNLGFEFRF